MRLIVVFISLLFYSLAHAQLKPNQKKAAEFVPQAAVESAEPAVLVPGGPGTTAPILPGGNANAPAIGVGVGTSTPLAVAPGALGTFDPNSGYSLMYPPAEDPELLEDEEEEEEDAEEEEAAFDITKMLPMLGGMGGGVGSFGSGADGGGSKFGDQANPKGPKSTETASLGDCGTAPQSVMDAYQEAVTYRNSCKVANRGDGQKIVINDYSGTNRGMYIFDAGSGQCIKKTAVTYGSGGASANGAAPCASSGSHATPPGFHLSSKNYDGSASGYDSSNSLRMYSLQRQGSSGRGVLIHGSSNPQQNLSWGCAGVGPIREVMGLVGSGSLVYNYFGDKSKMAGCGSDAGMRGDNTCELEGGNSVIPPGVTDVIDTGAEDSLR